jgi:hypothetical protein
MSRQPRSHQGASALYHHLMNRGHNRETVFRDEEDDGYFLEFLQRYRKRGTIRLGPNAEARQQRWREFLSPFPADTTRSSA